MAIRKLSDRDVSGKLKSYTSSRNARLKTPDCFSNCIFWLDADTIKLADGASVRNWIDSSDSKRNAQEDSLATAPIYKTNILNGHSAVRFVQGSSNQLNFPLQPLTNFTLFMVYSVASKGAYAGPFSWRGANTPGFQISGQEGGGTHYTPHLLLWNGVAESSHVQGSVAFSVPIPVKLYTWSNSLINATNTPSLRINGTAQTLSGGVTSYRTYPSGKLGLSYDFFGMDLSELLLYSYAMPLTEIQSVEAYLKTKYALVF